MLGMDLSVLTNEELIAKKKEYEAIISKLNNKQMAIKILINGEYGATANIYFRYYDLRLASAVTLSGQWAIRWIENYLMNHPLQKKYKWDVIYSDTDSLYICFYELYLAMVKKWDSTEKVLKGLETFTNKIIQPIINEGYDKLKEYCNANENKMIMKRETICSEVMFLKKKHYALNIWNDEGVVYKTPELKSKGIEVVRSSTPKLVRDRLKESIRKILNNDKKSLIDYIHETRKIFFNSTPETIAFNTSVNTLSKYEMVIKDIHGNNILSYKKGTPIGVRAALIYNSYIIKNDLYNVYPEIKEGEKIKVVYMKMPNPLHENAFGFVKNMPVSEDNLKQYVDYETQFFKSFYKPIKKIMEIIKDPISMINYVNIEDFFE